ncbi:MAG: flagellar export chaperone FliS [Alphaproteobacteria bacterium]|nr:flagellar export chaperone FliS [Alphaproteobacteria bacterium]
MDRNALQTYGTQQVMTSSPVKLVALLYEKAIVSLREAIQAIEAGRIEARWKANKRATEIISHLSGTLDHEAGGEISQNLQQLYDFMLTRLYEVDRNNDPQPARDVIGLLEPLHESWRKLAEQAAGSDAPAAPQAPAGVTADAEAPRPAEADAAPTAAAAGGVNLSA